jgi:hypothetical protein
MTKKVIVPDTLIQIHVDDASIVFDAKILATLLGSGSVSGLKINGSVNPQNGLSLCDWKIYVELPDGKEMLLAERREQK